MSEYFDFTILKTLRMPLYFLLSGLFFKNYGSFFNLIDKKINKLIVPFLFFSALALPIIFINFHQIVYTDLLDPFINPRGGYNGPVWFLLSLFWVNVLFGMISLISSNLIVQAVGVVILSCIGSMLGKEQVFLPLHITQALIALPFFFAGYLLKKTSLLYNNKFDRYFLVLSLVILIACTWIFDILDRPHIDFIYLDINGNMITIYLFSLIVVMSSLLICKGIRWLPVISYIGRFSVVVLGLHWLYIKAFSLSYTVLISPELNIPLRFVVVLAACWISIPIIIRYFPGLVAQKDLITLPRFRKNK